MNIHLILLCLKQLLCRVLGTEVRNEVYIKQLSLILIGGGDRGSSYLKYLQTNPDKFKLAALVEPVKEKREYLRDLYNVPVYKAVKKVYC